MRLGEKFSSNWKVLLAIIASFDWKASLAIRALLFMRVAVELLLRRRSTDVCNDSSML